MASKLQKMNKYYKKHFAKIDRKKILSEQIKDLEIRRRKYYYVTKKQPELRGKIGSGRSFAEQLKEIRKQLRRIK